MQLYLTQLNMGNTNVIFLFRDKEVGHFLVISPLMDKTLMDGGVGKTPRVTSFARTSLSRILFAASQYLDKYLHYLDPGICFHRVDFHSTPSPPKKSSWFQLYCLIKIVRILNKIFHNILNVDSLLFGSKQCNNRQREVTFQCIEINLSYVYKRKSHSSVFVLMKSFRF